MFEHTLTEPDNWENTQDWDREETGARVIWLLCLRLFYWVEPGRRADYSLWDSSERTKQMEEILNFQKPSEGLELVILLHTQY